MRAHPDSPRVGQVRQQGSPSVYLSCSFGISQPFVNHSQGPIGLTVLANIIHGLYDLEGSEEGIKVQSSFAVRLLSWSSLA